MPKISDKMYLSPSEGGLLCSDEELWLLAPLAPSLLNLRSTFIFFQFCSNPHSNCGFHLLFLYTIYSFLLTCLEQNPSVHNSFVFSSVSHYILKQIYYSFHIFHASAYSHLPSIGHLRVASTDAVLGYLDQAFNHSHCFAFMEEIYLSLLCM